jgi:hypothetical protein
LAVRIGAVLFALATAASCVIAEPPLDLPRLPPMRPVIVRGSVVPQVSAVLARWPQQRKFIVPVELVDPRATIFYSAFVDYNPATGDGLEGRPTASPYEAETTQGAVRTLEVLITEPSPDRCHVVEIVVALQFSSSLERRLAHTPLEPGGDSVSWFYSPGGDLAGCPTLDSGLAIVGDAEAEGGGDR